MPQPTDLAHLFDVIEQAPQGATLDPLEAVFADIEAAAAAALAAGKTADVGTDLLLALAEAGGVALVADVLAAGHAPAVLAALTLANPKDKRVKPRLGAGIITGHRVVWLLASGWSAVGQANRREASPTEKSLRHRLAASNLARGLARLEPTFTTYGLIVAVQQDVELREALKGWVQDVKPRGVGQDDPGAGGVYNGIFPDLLVVENWDPARLGQRAVHWPSVGGVAATAGSGEPSGTILRGDGADHIVAVEVELSGKANVLLSAKVANHDTAMRLGWWNAVVWITDDRNTLTRLSRAGIGDRTTHPGHYLMGTDACGLGPVPPDIILPAGLAPWWATIWGRAGL